MRSRRNKLIYLSTYVLILLCTLSGCGYTTKTVLPGGIKTIHVETFKNKIDMTKEVTSEDKYEIYSPGLEVEVRDAIIERVFLDGQVKVSTKDSSDAVLEGEILQYIKDPLRYVNEVVEEYRISLVCDVRLIRRKDSSVLLEEENIIGDATYFTTGALVKTESTALKEASRDLARRILNRIVEVW